MINPQMYIHGNIYPKLDSEKTVKKYLNLLDFDKENNVILDIGCGPGDTTWDVLKPHLPVTAKIIASDLNKEMLEYVKEHYPELICMQLDITTECLSHNLSEKFTHIFSFYCFNRFDNIRQAYLNTYNMLKPGGYLTMCFVVSHDIYFVYDHLSKHSKWNNIKCVNHIPQYHYFVDDADIKNNLKNILEDIGFDVLALDLNLQEYTFHDEDVWAKLMKSIDCYYLQLPEHLKEDYFQAWKQTYRKLFLRRNCDKYPVQYELVTLCAKKPL